LVRKKKVKSNIYKHIINKKRKKSNKRANSKLSYLQKQFPFLKKDSKSAFGLFLWFKRLSQIILKINLLKFFFRKVNKRYLKWIFDISKKARKFLRKKTFKTVKLIKEFSFNKRPRLFKPVLFRLLKYRYLYKVFKTQKVFSKSILLRRPVVQINFRKKKMLFLLRRKFLWSKLKERDLFNTRRSYKRGFLRIEKSLKRKFNFQKQFPFLKKNTEVYKQPARK